MTNHYTLHATPLGRLLLVSDGAAITGVHVVAGEHAPAVQPGWIPGRGLAVLTQLRRELDAYFVGRLRRFTVVLEPRGTEFQRRAWTTLAAIPYGETRTYGEQARAMGQPRAARAVGAANARNPIGIVVPCHRVIGADGSLTGYAGGLAGKEFLLKLEAGG